MKKDIKDYLHLYLGCEAICEAPQYPQPCKAGKFCALDLMASEQEQVCVSTGSGYYLCSVHQIKLALRPLSDMTEDEAVEFIHRRHKSILCNIDRTEITKVSFGETKNIIHFTYFRKRGAGAQGGGMTYYVNQSDPEQFLYLLSKGFDLFGLIEAGLAIDKTSVFKHEQSE